MALGALAASALGAGLGSLVGGALVGKPEYGFKDVAKSTTVSQLSPAQLQQILDDLTRAEGTARTDVSTGVKQAIGILTGDPNILQREQLVSQTSSDLLRQKQLDYFNQNINPGIESRINDLQNQYAQYDNPEYRQQVLNSFIDKFGGADRFEVAKRQEDADYYMSTVLGPISSKIGRLKNQQQQALNDPASVASMVKGDQLREFNRIGQGVDFTQEVRSIAQQQAPNLFATEGGTSVTDPYLKQHQALNLGALNQLAALSGLPGAQGQPALSPEEIQARLRETPGYQFRFNEGQRAVERAGAARGLLESGAILKGLTEFGQGIGSQEYNQEHARLASLAGLTSNAALAGTSQDFQRQMGVADLYANQGSGLAQIASGSAAQRSTATLQGGTRTQDTTKSMLFDVNRMKPVVG